MTTFDDIYRFFQDPPPFYLNKELAICYTLDQLLLQDSYGSELIRNLNREHPSYRLSDTVLYSAIKFLEDEGAIVGYWQKMQGRGRPRRMYQLNPQWRARAYDLARLWQGYVGRVSYVPRQTSVLL
jgi:DNA-binding PadR family transcriptional regulator